VAPRAATLLGATGPFRARVVMDAPASRAAIEGLAGQAAALPIAAAPVAAVGREVLAPPPGAQIGVQVGATRPAVRRVLAEAAPAAPRPPERLPEQVTQGPARPGLLWLEAGTYFRRDFAAREAARLPAGRVEALGVSGGPRGRQQQYRVRAGPFRSIAEADAALARGIMGGLAELRLAVD
jgi:rare lipoprotein A